MKIKFISSLIIFCCMASFGVCQEKTEARYFAPLPNSFSYEVYLKPLKAEGEIADLDAYPIKVSIQKFGKITHGICVLNNNKTQEAWIYDGVWLRELDNGIPVAFAPQTGASAVKTHPTPLLMGYLSNEDFPELTTWLENAKCIGEKKVEGVLCDVYVQSNTIVSTASPAGTDVAAVTVTPVSKTETKADNKEPKKNNSTQISSKGSRHSTNDPAYDVTMPITPTSPSAVATTQAPTEPKPAVQEPEKEIAVLQSGLYISKSTRLPFVFKDQHGEYRYRFGVAPTELKISGKWLDALNQNRDDAGLQRLK